MGIRRAIKRIISAYVSREYGLSLEKFVDKDKIPQGVDLKLDIERLLPGYKVDIVFDVGANTGQSARQYHTDFPGAKILCFEPGQDAFTHLSSNISSMENVKAYNKAFSNESRSGLFETHEQSVRSHIVKEDNFSGEDSISKVEIITLDDFCHKEAINEISFIKIDTEGHELQVLEGGRGLLKQMSIDLVEVEVGMNKNNHWHTPFNLIQEFFEKHHYYLFGFYEQRNERPSKQPHLRRANAVYISRDLLFRYSFDLDALSVTNHPHYDHSSKFE